MQQSEMAIVGAFDRHEVYVPFNRFQAFINPINGLELGMAWQIMLSISPTRLDPSMTWDLRW